MSRQTFAPPAGYELHEEVGRGGMGVVFRARHLPLDRHIALKFLKGGEADSPAARRFLDEARITAKLQHPGIPAVHEVGELPDGRPYLAMKLIQGRTLAELLKGKGPGASQWLGVFEGVCQAVGYAHAAGYVHRDLKPANVMVGAFGEVQVMDWGLAKLLASRDPLASRDRKGAGSDSPDDTRPVAQDSSAADTDRTNPYTPDEAADGTRAGTILGTPSYMAPEQARGEVDRIDRRADVFALGAILCQLLTGQPPLSGTVAQVIGDCAAGKFDAAFQRLDGCGEDRELIALCKRCLSVDPDARPADASAVATAVAQFRSESEARAKRAEVAAAEQRTRRRVQTWATVIAGGILLAGVVGTSVGLWQAEHRRVEADKARGREKDRADGEEKAKTKAEYAYAKTADVLDAMTSAFTRDAMTTQQVVTPEQRKFLGEALTYYRQFATRPADDQESLVRTARAAYRIGEIEYRLGRKPEAVAALQMSHDLWERLANSHPDVPDHRRETGGCRNSLALAQAALGLLTEAENGHRQAVTIRARLAAEYPSRPEFRDDLATSMTNLGNVLLGQGKMAEAERQYLAGLSVREKLATDHPSVPSYQQDMAQSLANLGSMLEDVGRVKEAEGFHRRGVAVFETLATDHPAVAEYRGNLASSRASLARLMSRYGNRKQAEEEYRKSLAERQRLVAEFPTVPEYRRELARTHNNTGLLLKDLGRWDDAVEQCRKSLVLRERLADDYPRTPGYRQDLTRSHNTLGTLLRDLGQWVESERLYRQGVSMLEKLVADFPDVPAYRQELATITNNLGNVLFQQGKLTEAGDQYRAAVAAREKMVADFPSSHQHRAELGGSYIYLGNLTWRVDGPQAGLAWHDKAVATLVQAYRTEPRDSQVKQTLRNGYQCRAQANEELGRYAEALSDWDRVLELCTAPERIGFRPFRALALVRAGQLQVGVAEVGELVKTTNWNTNQWHTFACVYSVAANGDPNKNAEYAAAAVELLTKSVKAGWKDAVAIRQNKDLDPLRDRADFKKLLADLEAKFPPKREVLPPPRRE